MLILVSLYFTLIKEKVPKFNEQNEWSGKLLVLPDNIEVSGDLLKLEGTVINTNKKKHKIIAFYRIKSEKEQTKWQENDQDLILSVIGKFETPLPQRNLNGFDYQKYLKHKGIYQIFQIESIIEANKYPNTYNRLFHFLSVVRKKAINHCNNVFGKETASYFNALLFGFKSIDFQQTEMVLGSLGILHLFSLSGMHVTFFIEKIRLFFLWIGVLEETVFYLEIVFLIFYAGMTGYSISVLRALIQHFIKLCNTRFNIGFSQLDCWSFTLFSCLFFNPYTLFSIGGQLSFSLSFFIIYVSQIVKNVGILWLKKCYFSVLLSLMTLPIMGSSFFDWQVTSSLLTFLLVPVFDKFLLPFISVSFFSSLCYSNVVFVRILEQYFLYQRLFFEWLANTMVFSISLGRFSTLLFFLSFVLLFLLIVFLLKRSKKILLIVFSLFLVINQKYFSLKGTVSFIDIGQGDSIFIQTPFHQENILIDTGGEIALEKENWAFSERKTSAEMILIPYLKSKGVKKLDKVFITHGHKDHFGNLLALSKKIVINELYYIEGTEKNTEFNETIQQLKKNGTNCFSVLAGEKIEATIPIEIIAPIKSGEGKNNDSMVLFSSIGEKKFLFTGDLEKEGEQQLIERLPFLRTDILKVGHHGSKTSSTGEFIQTLKPKEGIISCGRNNRFNHPNLDTITTLEKNDVSIYQTKEVGMIYYEWTIGRSLSSVKTIIKAD